MKKHLILLLSVLCVSGVVMAKAVSDRRLPFVVEADKATYSDITQTTVFDGRVVLTQGTTKIEADHIETIVDPEGYQFAKATMNGNGLVHFQQKREGSNEIIKAQGKKLIYDDRNNVVELSENAQMRRLTPSGRVIDKIDSDNLTYNQLTEIFESSQVTPGRTRVIVTPNSKTN